MMSENDDFKPAIERLVRRLREASLTGWRVGIGWGEDAGGLTVLPSVTHEASGTTYQKMYRFDSRQTAETLRSGELPPAEVERMLFGMIEALGAYERWTEPDDSMLLSYRLLDDPPAASPVVVEAAP